MPPLAPKKLQCECGSTFFYTTRAEQFSAGGYGTAEFRSMSQAPKTFLVCLCGRPAFPQAGSYAHGTQAAQAEKDFQESSKSALDVVNSKSLTNIANIAASPSEVAELRKEMDSLRQALVDATKPAFETPKAAVVRRSRAKASEAREDQSNGDTV